MLVKPQMHQLAACVMTGATYRNDIKCLRLAISVMVMILLCCLTTMQADKLRRAWHVLILNSCPNSASCSLAFRVEPAPFLVGFSHCYPSGIRRHILATGFKNSGSMFPIVSLTSEPVRFAFFRRSIVLLASSLSLVAMNIAADRCTYAFLASRVQAIPTCGFMVKVRKHLGNVALRASFLDNAVSHDGNLPSRFSLRLEPSWGYAPQGGLPDYIRGATC